MTDTQRADLVSKISQATTHAQQREAVMALDAYDQAAVQREATRRELNLADATIADTRRPVVLASAQGGMESDWLTEYDPGTDLRQAQASLIAQAGQWFERTAAEVKADRAEFGEQAEGFVRHAASAYGEHADALAGETLNYVGFLYRQAASGLPQIQQTVDSHDVPAPTPLPQDVFDNFAPPVDPINEGVVGTETSMRAPQMQEAAGNAGAQGAPEQPSAHMTGTDYSNSYSEIPPGGGMDAASGPTLPMEDNDTDDSGWAREASLFDSFRPVEADDSFGEPIYTTTAALGYTETLQDVWARMDKQAASGLDEIQQVVDPEENPKPTPLPVEVAFPWLLGEENPQADDQAKTASQMTAREHSNLFLNGYHEGHQDVRRQQARERTHGITYRYPVANPYEYGTESHAGWRRGAGEARNGDQPMLPQPSWENEDHFAFHGDDDPSLLGPLGRGASRKTALCNEPSPDGERCVLPHEHEGSHHSRGDHEVWDDPKTGARKQAEYKYVKQQGDKWVVTQKGTGKVLSHHDSKEDAEASFRAMMMNKHSGLDKQADQWNGQAETPQHLVQPQVANSADTASMPPNSGSYAQGVADAHDPAQRADYLDNSSAVPREIKDYSQGYSDGSQGEPGTPLGAPEPFSMTDAQGAQPVMDATVRGRVSARFTDARTAAHVDFKKGYRFASRWRSGDQLVGQGSPEFEAGLYAAVVDRPEIRDSWRAAHRRQASTGLQMLAQRIEDNDAYTDYLQATAGIDVTAYGNGEYTLDALRDIQSRDPDGWEHRDPSPEDYDAHHNWAVKTYGPRAWKHYISGGWDTGHVAAKKTASFWNDEDAKARAIAENDPNLDGKIDPEEFETHRQNSVGEYGDRAWERYENQAREEGHPYWSKQGSRKQAGTNAWLDSTDGESSPSPTGQTPFNGPGTEPLLDGQGPANAPGGPSPYNGAEPYGKGVVPTTMPAVSPNAPTVQDLPGGPVDRNLNLDSTERLSMFRRTVQASVLANNLKEGSRA